MTGPNETRVTQADREAKKRIQQRILTEGASESQVLDEELARHRQSAQSDLLAALREAREKIAGMVPKNVCLTNQRWPDETVVPIDATLGEFRALSATLATIDAALAQHEHPRRTGDDIGE